MSIPVLIPVIGNVTGSGQQSHKTRQQGNHIQQTLPSMRSPRWTKFGGNRCSSFVCYTFAPFHCMQTYITSFSKTEVHNVSPRRPRRTKPRPQAISQVLLCDCGVMRADRQTDRQTEILATIFRTSSVPVAQQWQRRRLCSVYMDACRVDRSFQRRIQGRLTPPTMGGRSTPTSDKVKHTSPFHTTIRRSQHKKIS